MNYELLNKFLDTYDTKYIDNMSIEFKNFIKDFLIQYENKNNKGFPNDEIQFPGLYIILFNHFNYPQELFKHVNILSDIRSITYMESKHYDKKIYIFGEIHKEFKLCDKNKIIEKCGDFIIRNLKTTDKFIDLFIELPYIRPKELSDKYDIYKSKFQSYNIQSIIDAFPNCFDPHRQKYCEYENIRFHMSDIRIRWPKYNYKNPPFLRRLTALLTYPSKTRYLYDNYKVLIEFKNLINDEFDKEYPEEMKEYKSITTINQFITFLLKQYNFAKIYKQQEKIIYPEVKDILIKTLFENINKLNIDYNYTFNYKHVRKILNMLPSETVVNEWINTKGDTPHSKRLNYIYSGKSEMLKFIDEYKKLSDNFLYIDAYFMDLYLISRIFRTFEQIPYKNSKESKNIIIMVGNTHAENYKHILEQLKFETLFHKRSEKLCINIDKLKQPLFTN